MSHPNTFFQERLDLDSDIKTNHQYNVWETPSCLSKQHVCLREGSVCLEVCNLLREAKQLFGI